MIQTRTPDTVAKKARNMWLTEIAVSGDKLVTGEKNRKMWIKSIGKHCTAFCIIIVVGGGLRSSSMKHREELNQTRLERKEIPKVQFAALSELLLRSA